MDIKLNIPDTLEGISLRDYQEFIKTQTLSNDEEFVAQKMISLFCGISMPEVLKIRLTSLNDLIEHFGNVFNEKPKLKERLTINGVEYGFVPNLDKLSFGEYIDIEKFISECSTYHRALAVLYRPITNKYKHMHDIEEYEPSNDKDEVFKDVSVSVAISATLFFYRLGLELSKSTLSYLEAEVSSLNKNKQTFQVGDNSLRNGVTTQAYTQSLRETLTASIQLQDLDFLNVSPILHLKKNEKK